MKSEDESEAALAPTDTSPPSMHISARTRRVTMVVLIAINALNFLDRYTLAGHMRTNLGCVARSFAHPQAHSRIYRMSLQMDWVRR